MSWDLLDEKKHPILGWWLYQSSFVVFLVCIPFMLVFVCGLLTIQAFKKRFK